MYYRRKIDDYLKKWKEDPSHKPLIVKGARQIGKTESLLHFAKSNYENVVYINFALEKKFINILADGYDVGSVIKNITLADPSKKFIPDKTIILFDEIQENPDIATTLKSFKIDAGYDVICSGSMLGVNYKKIESNSVGYKMDYTMYSLDFEEFLWAKGYAPDIRQSLFEHMTALTPFNDLELSVFHDLFLDFSILGGMPAVVRDYIEYGTFEGSLDTQRQLLADYNEDIRKYAQGLDQGRILNVFEHIPIQLAKDNKKFQISKVASGARFKDYRGCIEWLRDAGIVNVCHCLNFPELPLKGNYDDTKYKLYIADTGLLVAMLDEEAQEDLRAHKNLGVYKGALYENIVAEGLTKSGYALYYFKKASSTLEEDFFVRTSDSLVPIEVKATNNKSKSLNTLIQSPAYSDIRFGIKLIGGNIGHENDIYTFPYFCTFLVRDFLRQLPPSPAHMV